MSNLTELITNIHDSESSSLNIFGAAVGTIADFSGGIGAVVSAVGLVESLISPSQSDALLSELHDLIVDGFRRIDMSLKAAHYLDRMRDIDTVGDKATTVYSTLHALVTAVPPPGGEEVRQKLQDCIESLVGFRHADKWSVVFADQGFFEPLHPRYQGGGASNAIFTFTPTGGTSVECQGMTFTYDLQPQADPQGLVFNYLYVLPAYMKALMIFLATGAALDPKFVANYSDEITANADWLEQMHDAVKHGILNIAAPSHDDMTSGDTDVESAAGYFADTSWFSMQTSASGDQYSEPYGAVNIWSGFTRIDDFPALTLPTAVTGGKFPPEPGDDYMVGVVSRYLLRSLARQKQMYRDIGLPAVWRTINRLRGLVGQPPLGPICFGDWSMREAFDLLNYPQNPILLPPNTFFQRTASMLRAFTLRSVPLADPSERSLRVLLDGTPSL